MIKHLLNLFPVTDLADLKTSYNLLEVVNLPANSQYAENVQRLALMVAKDVRKPVSIYREGDKTFLATTADPEIIKGEWRLIPQIAVLKPDSRSYDLNYSSLRPEQIQIALNMLRYTIRTHLTTQPQLWNDRSNSFYFRESKNPDKNSNVDVLEGFSFRLHLIDGKILISLDPTVRYIDRLSLLEHLNLGEDFNQFKFQHFLYRFGYRWYRVQLIMRTNTSIREQLFYHEKYGETYNVYDYTLQDCRKPYPAYIKNLDPQSEAILYRYPNTSKDLSGAAALCFKTYKTGDAIVNDLHKLSILNPATRLAKSRTLIQSFFQQIHFNQQEQFQVSNEPLSKSVSYFPIPDLLFGNNKNLHVKEGKNDTGIFLEDWGQARMNLVLDHEVGLLAQGMPQPQYLFIPASLERSISEAFKQEFTRQMERFLTQKYEIKPILYDDKSAKNLRQQVEAIKKAVEKNKIDRGCAILILPENAYPDLHNYIKKQLFEKLQFQCVQASSLKRYFIKSDKGFTLGNSAGGKFVSYTRYSALGMLMVNRRWLYALKTSLNYDIYIGIDVLNGVAGFTYVYNGGKDCYFRHYITTQKEKLSKKQIYDVLSKDLKKDLENLELKPQSIVIHRDGTSFAQEEQGFVAAIKYLQKEGILNSSIEIGIVEIHKLSQMRLRIYGLLQDNRVENPTIGDYFVVNAKQGIVCTTGYPFRFSGTANPLHVAISYGNLNIEKILADSFALSQLAWSAPDKASKYPITIKLGDMFLQPIAGNADDEAALYDDEEFTESEDEDEADEL